MINPKRRKVGDLCFLKLDGYQPPWRQAVIVKEGKGAKFILVVRMLDQEIEDKTEEISFFAMGGEKFLLVEGKANQLRSTCLNPHRALEVEGQKLVAFTRTKLADEDLHYVTASEDLAEDSSKRKTHSMGESSGSEGPESSEEDDKVLEMLVRAQKLERGKGIVSEDRAQSSKEKPKRYPMLQGKTGEKDDTGINFEQMLLQSLASKGSEPAKTDQHLQTLLTLEVLKRRGFGCSVNKQRRGQGIWSEKGCRKGYERFPRKSQSHASEAIEARQKVHQRDRGDHGSFGRSWIQHQRLYPQNPMGQTKIADAYTLRSVGTSAVSAQRKAGAGCSTSSTIAPGDSSELLGRGIVESGIIIDATCRSPRQTPFRGRSCAIRRHRDISQSHPGSREEKRWTRRRSRYRSCKESKRRKGKEARDACRDVSFLPQCFVAPSAEECLVSKLIKKGHGSFSRFAKQYARSHRETGGCTPISHGDLHEVSLFPSQLPWIKPPVRSRGRRGHSSKQRWEAFVRMHWIWGLCNFLECGSPCNHDAAQNVVEKASSGVWTKQHECYAKAMYLKILRFVSHPEGTLERGTAKLNDLISRIRLSFYDPKITFDEAFSSAMSVNPERISLPEEGGILDPGQHLTGRQLRQFKRMRKNIPHGLETCKETKPCHKVEPQDWPILLKKLWGAKMISFVPIEDALCENGKLVKGGLFCVPHKPTSDRLINDRRPLNARESRLDWSKLPAGHMLCQLVLEKNESIRCSGDDLSNYFYLIKHSPEWLPRNCFGDPILGEKSLGRTEPQKEILAELQGCLHG